MGNGATDEALSLFRVRDFPSGIRGDPPFNFGAIQRRDSHGSLRQDGMQFFLSLPPIFFVMALRKQIISGLKKCPEFFNSSIFPHGLSFPTLHHVIMCQPRPSSVLAAV